MMRKRIVEMSEQVARLRATFEPLALPPAFDDEVRRPVNGTQPEPALVTPARVSLRELHAGEENPPLHPIANEQRHR